MTVNERKKEFTRRQIKKADHAKNLKAMLGFPSTKNFKIMFSKKHIKNCLNNTEDIYNCLKIYGEDKRSLKGKATSSAPLHIDPRLDPLPKTIRNIKNVTIAIDIMFVNNLPFLVSISREIKFRT